MQDISSTIKKQVSDFYDRVVPYVEYVTESIRKNFDIPLVKNASHLMLGAGLQSGLTFVFWILAARLFDAHEVGLTTALLSVLSIFAIVAELGFGMGLIRFLPGAGTQENDLINTCFTLSSLVAGILAILFMIGLPVWGQSFIPLFSSPVFILIFVVFSVVVTLQPLLGNIFLGKRTTKFIVFTTAIICVSRIAFLLVIVFFAHSVFGLVFISFLSTFAGLLIGLTLFLPSVMPAFRLAPVIHLGLLREIRNYTAVNYVSRLILQITPLIIPLMVVNILGSEMNAYFAMSWTIVAIMQVIPTSLFNSFLAESVTERTLNKKNFRKVLFLMLELLVPATIAVIFLSGFILSVFGAAYAEEGTPLVRILALSIIPWGIIYLFITVERYKKSSLGIVFSTLAAALLSLGLSFLMMETWGLIGLGIGYLAGQVVVALIVGMLMWRMMDKDQFERDDSSDGRSLG